MTLRLRFHSGTLVLEGVDRETSLPAAFRLVKGKPRCPAVHYAALLPWLREHDVHDVVPRWRRLDLQLADPRQLHLYQTEALAAWQQAGERGSVVLPTGAGKTLVAIHAIARLARSTLVVVPTTVRWSSTGTFCTQLAGVSALPDVTVAVSVTCLP